MTTFDISRKIINRLKNLKYIILSAGLIVGIILFIYAKRTPETFISRATIFPLTSTPESSTASSALSVLLGTESKSFSDDASINIVELAQSRTTREAVAATIVPSLGNKTIATLLIEDINSHLSWMEPKIKTPATQEQLFVKAGEILEDNLKATINRNNMLVITYTGRSEGLVKAISYEFISKISQYYIDLKREKAMRDYQFAVNKADSLRRVMGAKDYQLIAIDKRTLFTDVSKLQFRVPTENLLADKQMVRSQYIQAVSNRENAAYKLQKATPLIKVLDKPDPPYPPQRRSAPLYGLIGFFIGSILFAGLAITGLILKLIKLETSKAIFGNSKTNSTTTTTATVL